MTEARPRKQVNIYTDGACSGNPGPGGWGCILEFGPHRRNERLYGGRRRTIAWSCSLQSVRWGR